MSHSSLRLLVTSLLIGALLLIGAAAARACAYDDCTSTELNDGAVDLRLSSEQANTVLGAGPAEVVDYAWRLRPQCVVAAETTGNCSPASIRTCPQEPGRAIEYLYVQQRPVVRPDGTVVEGNVPAGAVPGDPVGDWTTVREECIDITALNPPPSPAEVFAYFQRLPLPQLQTRHQPPGDGLAGLPVVFYTDSPITQSFTVDIRGFTVTIDAHAERYTWETGDGPPLTSTDPGRPYPDHTVEHEYSSGTYTARLTVTWGATFSVDGSAPADVPGTTTTEGPPVTFDVLEARPVLTDPYD